MFCLLTQIVQIQSQLFLFINSKVRSTQLADSPSWKLSVSGWVGIRECGLDLVTTQHQSSARNSVSKGQLIISSELFQFIWERRWERWQDTFWNFGKIRASLPVAGWRNLRKTSILKSWWLLEINWSARNAKFFQDLMSTWCFVAHALNYCAVNAMELYVLSANMKVKTQKFLLSFSILDLWKLFLDSKLILVPMSKMVVMKKSLETWMIWKNMIKVAPFERFHVLIVKKLSFSRILLIIWKKLM